MGDCIRLNFDCQGNTFTTTVESVVETDGSGDADLLDGAITYDALANYEGSGESESSVVDSIDMQQFLFSNSVVSSIFGFNVLNKSEIAKANVQKDIEESSRRKTAFMKLFKKAPDSKNPLGGLLVFSRSSLLQRLRFHL
jgi:hypothetical protein